MASNNFLTQTEKTSKISTAGQYELIGNRDRIDTVVERVIYGVRNTLVAICKLIKSH